MAEIWGAAIAVGGTLISSYAKSKQNDRDKADAKAMTEADWRHTAQQTAYESALENYYSQKERYEKQRGLDQYRQFSTMGQFAPGVNDQGGRITDPVMPQYNSFAPTDPNATTVDGGGGKGGKGILGKVDPLGSKLINFDPIGKKLFGGLF